MMFERRSVTADAFAAVVIGSIRGVGLHVRVVTGDARQRLAALALAPAERHRFHMAHCSATLLRVILTNEDSHVVRQRSPGR